MSVGNACACKPREVRVLVYKGNHSYFNAGPRGSFAPSNYSLVRCVKCGRSWRTKAKWIEKFVT